MTPGERRLSHILSSVQRAMPTAMSFDPTLCTDKVLSAVQTQGAPEPLRTKTVWTSNAPFPFCIF